MTISGTLSLANGVTLAPLTNTQSIQPVTNPGELGTGSLRYNAALDTITAGNLNNILFVDGVNYATIDAAVAAFGSNPGLVIVPSTYAGANLTPSDTSKVAVLDLRTNNVLRIHSAANESSTNPAASQAAQIFLRSDTTNTQPVVTNLRNRLLAMQVGKGGTGTAASIYGNVFWQGNMGGGETQAHNGIYGETQLYNITGIDAADVAIGGEFKGSVSGAGNSATIPNAWGVFGQGQIVATGGDQFNGTVTNLTGVRGQLILPVTSTGTVTNFRALHAAPVSDGGSSVTVTNAYGLYVDKPGYGTNQWAIYVADGTVRSDGGELEVRGATNPLVRTLDTTNTVQAKLQSLDTTGVVGTETNHDFEIRTNNAIAAVFDAATVKTARFQRVSASRGTALVAGDFALSAGFGSTASVGAIIGTDQGFQFVVTSAGTGQGANPTITVTDKDGTWTNSPVVIVKRSAGSQLTVVDTWTVTATALTITFNGTPVAAETYTYNVIKMGR